MKIKRNKKGLGLSSSKGFTLIEVVLVLAIGGLIFLLAFLAFQQVSTNRRDTQRRNDAGRVLSELQNYKGDVGSYPADITTAGTSGGTIVSTGNAGTAQTFFTTYMGGANFKDPGGNAYSVVLSTGTPTVAAGVTQITYRNGHKCNPSAAGTVASAGNIAVQVGLEKGVVCRDDS